MKWLKLDMPKSQASTPGQTAGLSEAEGAGFADPMPGRGRDGRILGWIELHSTPVKRVVAPASSK